ncbi:uncharacterized oxidoreductase YjhC-like [Protopterus annectens]|uniref:uncharacterized oxidoreductase YjhC-like n=1 Tax=Protopterus annectens TaxID=7888 RepID=UPI001CF9C5E4|nr:uncharacterized oxidoreductase YjhC-like [Protopterus annectens]
MTEKPTFVKFRKFLGFGFWESKSKKMAPCVKVIVIGAGSRGQNYSNFALDFPERMKVVGVADPQPFVRRSLQEKHSIEDCNVFDDWTAVTKREKFADAAIICTPDKLHKDPAIAFAKKGYHILLEKPMAVTEEDCKEIVSVCKDNEVMLSLCHVLRYFPAVLKIKELLKSGVIGDVVHIQHLEPSLKRDTSGVLPPAGRSRILFCTSIFKDDLSHTYHENSITYLDIELKKNIEEQRYVARIYRKPTYSNTMLHLHKLPSYTSEKICT